MKMNPDPLYDFFFQNPTGAKNRRPTLNAQTLEYFSKATSKKLAEIQLCSLQYWELRTVLKGSLEMQQALQIISSPASKRLEGTHLKKLGAWWKEPFYQPKGGLSKMKRRMQQAYKLIAVHAVLIEWKSFGFGIQTCGGVKRHPSIPYLMSASYMNVQFEQAYKHPNDGFSNAMAASPDDLVINGPCNLTFLPIVVKEEQFFEAATKLQNCFMDLTQLRATPVFKLKIERAKIKAVIEGANVVYVVWIFVANDAQIRDVIDAQKVLKDDLLIRYEKMLISDTELYDLNRKMASGFF